MTQQRRFLHPFGGCVRPRWGRPPPPAGPLDNGTITHDAAPPFLSRGRAATLGDVWDDRGCPDTTHHHPLSPRARAPCDAYASGSIRSVDVGVVDADDGGDERSALSVRFENACGRSWSEDEDDEDDDDSTLVLCWVDKSGSPHHFYRLEVGSTHVERTYLGDAFVLARVAKPSNRKEHPASEMAGSDDGGKTEGDGRNADNGRKNKKSPRFRLDPEDVVAAYRPKRLRIPLLPPDGDGRRVGSTSSRGREASSPLQSMTTTESAAVPRRPIHVVVVTRRRRRHPLPVCLFPWVGGSRRRCKPRYEINIRVEEGKSDGPPLDTSDKFYETETLAGWPARCEPGCWDDDDRCVADGGADRENGDDDGKSPSKLRELFMSDLRAASDDVPPHALEKLRKSTTLWINRSQSFGPASNPTRGRGMCYHPDEDWLKRVGMSTDKVGGIELYKSSDYTKDRELWGPGGVLLHELSHAYHHEHVPDGYDNADVTECYEAAMAEGIYDCVKVHGSQGPTCRAYACTDRMEYFAEMSVAFLGGCGSRREAEHNKWFPFNRTQLREHDPRAYDMLKRIWGVAPEEPLDDG